MWRRPSLASSPICCGTRKATRSNRPPGRHLPAGPVAPYSIWKSRILPPLPAEAGGSGPGAPTAPYPRPGRPRRPLLSSQAATPPDARWRMRAASRQGLVARPTAACQARKRIPPPNPTALSASLDAPPAASQPLHGRHPRRPSLAADFPTCPHLPAGAPPEDRSAAGPPAALENKGSRRVDRRSRTRLEPAACIPDISYDISSAVRILRYI